MRRFIFIIVVSLFALVFTACSAGSQAVSQQSASGSAPVPVGTGREMPLVMKLALGTFKLDETDYPVTAEQAKEFLPLWKAARSLSQSETVANEEIQAVINQIQDTMTTEQMQAIEGMDLSFQDMGAIAQELGLDFSSRFGNMSPEMQATMQAARESGQAPQGGFGAFGPGGPGGPGEGSRPEARQTAVAERGGLNGTGLGLPSAFLDAIIEFLEAKAK